MQLQRERRRDPYPWTWEIPAAVAMVMGLAAVLGIQLGRGAANLVAGAGWTWPETSTHSTGAGKVQVPSPMGDAFWSSIPSVLAGDAGAGLARTERAGDLAGAGMVWAGIALAELSLLGALTWALVAAYQRWGPGRMRGMASREDAETLLGRTRLRKVAPIVRPDLHAKRAGPGGIAPAVYREASDVGSRGDGSWGDGSHDSSVARGPTDRFPGHPQDPQRTGSPEARTHR